MAEIRLETPRLVLRPWHAGDVGQLTAGLNDLDLARWLALVPHPYAAADAENWIRRCRALATSGPWPVAHEFAIELRETRAMIGGVSLNKIDRQAGTGGGGIWIAEPYQGYGYGREAFEAKIRFAFDVPGLETLVNGYFDGNEKSWSLQRTLGYRRVAEVPARCLANGRKTVEHVTTLSRTDWERREHDVSARA